MTWPWRRAAVLAAVVLVAHFLPPERSAPSPDDLATAYRISRLGVPESLRSVVGLRERPLLHGLSVLHAAWTWDDPWRAVPLLAVMALLVSMAAYSLFRELLQDEDLAFVAAVTYALLPNKLELFHTGMYAVLMVMHALQIGAALLLLRALRLGSTVTLIASLCAYGAGCLMNESGLFLPLALAAWAAARRLPRVRWSWWFVVPLLLIAALYLQAAGQTPVMGGRRVIQWQRVPHNVFVVAPQFFFGRYIARAVLYGFAQFPGIEARWLALALLLDGVACVAAWRWLSRTALSRPSSRLLCASVAVVALLLVPNMLFFIEDRHLALADLGFTVLLLPLVAASRRVPALAALGLAGLLVVAQGNGWSHVVACRINRALEQAVADRRADVAAARVVIFDLASFTDRIPYTWGGKSNNPLATYYGAQVFAPWGLFALVRLAGGEAEVVASRQPVVRSATGWEFLEWASRGRRHAPAAGSMVIGYSDVYACGFDRGERRPCPRSHQAPLDDARR